MLQRFRLRLPAVWFSLRFRIIVVTAAIPLLAILAVAFFASRATASEFDGLVAPVPIDKSGATIVTIHKNLAFDANAPAPPNDEPAPGFRWQLPGFVPPMPSSDTSASDTSSRGVFALPVQDSAAPVDYVRIASTAGLPAGTVLSGTGQSFAVFGAKPFTALYRGDQQKFLAGVNRNLLIAAIGAAVVSTAFAAFSARRLTNPLEALTAAARRLGSGDLAHRVTVPSRDEVGELALAFNAMAQSLERGERLRRSMTSDIAHELRTPLQSLAGYLDAAADGVVETDASLVQALREETTVLVRLVEDLEQIALSDSGELRLRLRPAAPASVIERCLELARPRAADQGVALESDLAEPLPAIEADPDRLSQVLRNLLENAITHTPAGGRITVRASSEDSALVIEVTDTGSGIAAEHLPFIFERFYRADSSRTRATGGAGLGLAIVRQLVAAHGGSVSATSTPGAGSTFTVILPVGPGAAPAPEP
jgi:signal transduction histidine kinase